LGGGGRGGKKGCHFCKAVNPAPFASAAFFFYGSFLRSSCCNSAGCKQNLIYPKFMTGQAVHFAHLWGACKGNRERAFQKLQLEMQQFPCCLERQCQRDFYF